MLRPGGRLVYSTCTFAPEENEGTILHFLEQHPEFSVEAVPAYEGFGSGHPEWVGGCFREKMLEEQVRRTWRLWPHKLEGEGHYVAVLRKAGGNLVEQQWQNRYQPVCDMQTGRQAQRTVGKNQKRGGKGRTESGTAVDKSVLAAYEAFAKENLLRVPQGVPVLFGEQLYLMPEAVELKGLKVLRAGLHVGSVSKNRFEPSHALALALGAKDAVRTCSLKGDSALVRAYLRGETVPAETEKGWCLVLVDGYSLGWGKVSEGILKNHYPKGLRWNA